LLEDAVNYAFNNNVSVVVSTGNGNATIEYPAKYTNAIAVGSTNSNDLRSRPFFWSATSGSNFGAELDFVAPGNFIYGLSHTSNTNYNSYWGGTSQAAPHVTGVISLLLSINPNLTVSQILLILKQSSQDRIGDSFDILGFDQYYGFGRINAFNAISSPLLSNTDYFTESQKIKLFPNPIGIENTFSISGLESNVRYTIKVISLDGKVVKELKNNLTNGIVNINTDLMPPGIYLVTIYNVESKLMFNKKVVKK